jgi:hypothetical protein
MTNCFVCGKKKEDHEVWWNKIAICITYDSEFQNNEIISNMSDKSMMCHACIKTMEKKVGEKNKL